MERKKILLRRAIILNGNGLSYKQDRFVEEYLKDGNETRAADRAGFGYPYAAGEALMCNQKVLRALATRRVALAEECQVTQEQVTGRLVKVAFADVRSLFDEQGDPLPINEIPTDVAPLLQGIKKKRRVTKAGVEDSWSYDTYNQLQAMDMLNRILGGYEKDNVQRVNVTINQLLAIMPEQIREPLSKALLAQVQKNKLLGQGEAKQSITMRRRKDGVFDRV